MDCSTSGFPVLHYLQSLLKLMLVMLSKHLIFCCPLLLNYALDNSKRSRIGRELAGCGLVLSGTYWGIIVPAVL